MKKNAQKFLAILLSVAMLCTMVCAAAFTASALEQKEEL